MKMYLAIVLSRPDPSEKYLEETAVAIRVDIDVARNFNGLPGSAARFQRLLSANAKLSLPRAKNSGTAWRPL